MQRNRITVALAFSALALAAVSTGCQKLKARDNLNKGVACFKGAKYSEAVTFFQEAVNLDPEYPTARLYLATAYMSQYIPGAASPENLAFVKNAMDNFQKVLDRNPKDTTAIESIASLNIQQTQGLTDMKDKVVKLDEAKVWYERLKDVDPTNKTAFYSLGFITWSKWYPALMEARAKLGMKQEDPGPLKDKKVREELVEKYMPMINDGIKNLEKAIEIDKEYDDAMAYMNLLYRERADLAESKADYEKDTDTADKWVNRALEVKKIKTERDQKKGSTGIVQEEKKKAE
jgi:tetratricopeptide (TPR) repeat protein